MSAPSRPIFPPSGRRQSHILLSPTSSFAPPSSRHDPRFDIQWQSRRGCGDIRLLEPVLMPDLFQQPRQPYNNQGYMPNGAPMSGPVPGATPLLPNQGRVLQHGPIRVLCIADVRGRTSTIFTSHQKCNANIESKVI
ncbi:hypothetical protein RRF57_001970 [Xylaria bambusicola]|uniref:Uncharacterized protein n=1 Tax=Xylaria bambusicola TaxID=326684 RepID=A0AAN7YVA1_9PEZI